MAHRVLITGSTGLLGRWVLRYWPDGLERVAISHRRMDLTNPETFLSAIDRVQPDLLLHLAWTASGTPHYRSSSDNAAWMTTSMAAAKHCLEHGIHFVGTGTGIDHLPPVDAYSRSKAELRAALSHEIASEAVTWLRPFFVFDVAAERPRLVADTQNALRNDAPVLLQSPWTRHDFVHASDVGSAIVACMSHDLRGAIDIGSGQLRSVAELVEACGASWQSVARQAHTTQADVAANLKVLGTTRWTPSTTDDFFRD